MPKTILIVEDEQDIAQMLRDYFQLEGYQTIVAVNGKQALKKAEAQPDMILLDVGLPDMDGMEICKALRRFVPCPILFLTARVSEQDKLQGFAAGGDDYIVKPFSLKELGARVDAHLRREERNQTRSRVRFGKAITVDYGQRCLYIDNEPLKLPKKEFDILALLSVNAGQVFDREHIYERVWGMESDGDSAVVAEHVRRIRAALAPYGLENAIETVWGVGYKWTQNA